MHRERVLEYREIVDLLNYFMDSPGGKFDEEHLIYILKNKEWKKVKEETARIGGQPKDLQNWWKVNWTRFENEIRPILSDLTKKHALMCEVRDAVLYTAGPEIDKLINHYMKKITGVELKTGINFEINQQIIGYNASISDLLGCLLKMLKDPSDLPRYGFCLECGHEFNVKVPVYFKDDIHFAGRIDILVPYQPEHFDHCPKCQSKRTIEFARAYIKPVGWWWKKLYKEKDRTARREWIQIQEIIKTQLCKKFKVIERTPKASQLDHIIVYNESKITKKEIAMLNSKYEGGGWSPVDTSKRGKRIRERAAFIRDREIARKLRKFMDPEYLQRVAEKRRKKEMEDEKIKEELRVELASQGLEGQELDEEVEAFFEQLKEENSVTEND